MKKIIALILALIFVIPCYASVAFADNTADAVVNSDFEEAYGVLNALGFLSDDIKALDLTNGISRGQFAHLVACVRGVQSNVLHDGSYGFIDVQPDHIYATEIYNLRKMGVISGANSVQYLPDNPITYNEVSKILVKIMGYELKAELAYGGYPLGYVRVIDNLDIIDTAFSGTDNVTLQDAITMCFNSALADVVEMVSIKNNEPTYESKKGQNIFTEYHDIYVSEGIMKDNGFTALSGASAVSLDRVVVGNAVINKGANGFEGSIGKMVRAYYHISGSKNTLKYVHETEDNDALVVDAENLTNHNNGTAYKLYYYNDSDKQKLAELDSLVDFIFNGKAYVDFVKDDLYITEGTIELINNDSDKQYDVVLVTVPQSFVVSSVDTNGEKIYGKYGEIVSYEECDSFKVLNKNGFEITASEIKTGDVVTAVLSKDKKIVQINATGTKVSGVVEQTYEEDGITYYGINNEYYRYSTGYANAVKANKNPKCKTIEIGSEYTFSIDEYGYICDVELGNSTGFMYAYLINAAPDTQNMETVIRMRLFGQDGTFIETQAAKKVNLNGSSIDGKKLIDDKTSDFYRGKAYIKPQLVQIKLNAKGELTDINLYKEANAYGYNANEFSKDRALNDVKYRGGNVMSLGGVYQVTQGALIFCVPSYDDFEDEALQIWTISRLTSGAKYNFEVYDADSSLTTDVFLVVNDEPGSVFDTQVFVVNEIVRGLNDDGDAVKMVSGVSNGAYVTYTEAEKGDVPDTVKPGDVLRISRDGNMLTGVEVVASAASNPAPFVKFYDGSSSVYEHDFIVQCGYLYGKSDRAVSVINTDEYATAYGKIISHSVNENTKVTVWDNRKKEATPGTLADVITNDIPNSDGTIAISENSTKVIVYRRQDYLREIVVIK